MNRNFKDMSFRLISETAVSKVENQAIMLDLNSGTYFELNEVGLFIVENLNSFISFQKINELVIESFDINARQCNLDVNLFLNDLKIFVQSSFEFNGLCMSSSTSELLMVLFSPNSRCSKKSGMTEYSCISSICPLKISINFILFPNNYSFMEIWNKYLLTIYL